MGVQEDKLWQAFEIASKNVKAAKGFNSGGQAAENQYAAAYTALVRAGLAQKLKQKYRGR